MKTRLMVCGSVAILLFFFTAAPARGAVGGEPGLPGRPWMVVQFAGACDLADAWNGTALGRMTADPEIAPALREARNLVRGLILSQAADLPDRRDVEETLNSLFEMLGSPWMLGIYPPPEPGAPPSVAMTARLADPTAALAKRLRAALAQMAGADALEEIPMDGADAFRIRGGEGLSAFAAAGDRFSGASDPELLDELLAAEGLPANVAAILARLKTGVPAARVYVDIGAVLDMVAAQEPEAGRAFDAFGMNALGALAVEIGFDGEMIHGASRIAFRGEGPWRIAELMRGEPLSDEDLAAIPPNAFSFSVVRVDLARLWDYVMEGVGSLNPEGIEELNAALAGLKEQIGIDVEQDIVHALGTRLSAYSTPGAGMMPGMGNMTMIWTLRDPERFRGAMGRAMELAAQLLDARQAQQLETPVRFKIQSSEGEGIQVWYLAGLPLAAPAIGVGANALAFSLQPNTCRAELLRLGSSASSILSNADFEPAWARLRGTVQSVSYDDLRATIPGLYQAAIGFAPMLAASKGVHIDLAKLPTVDAISRYLAPAFAWDGMDEEGFYSEWTSPIGIAGAGNPANPAVIGMAAGIAMPALARARDQARSAVCAGNLKQLGVALMMYELDSEDGLLPAKLADLTPTYISRALSCPSAGGYLYLAPAVRLGDIAAPGEFVVAMDDAPRHRGGRNALFADGHVEWIPEAGAQAVLEAVGTPAPRAGD